MKSRSLITSFAVLLTITLVAPSIFLIAPQKAEAIPSFETNPEMILTNLKTSVESTIDVIENTITAIAAPISAAANVAMQINAYVLQPLAFILSGNLLKMITAGVIKFVIGKANGTGIPQFVVDVQKSLQTVGDAKALAFFNQYGRNSNSPFAASITSSLRNNYLSKTSLAGFWAENMNTLARSTPNVNAYLAGNWSQGGVAAWFALTTQTQNNPYTLYQNSQSQLSGLIGAGVGGATGARLSELNWGKGFMSWCGANTNSVQTAGVSCPVGSTFVVVDNKCEYGDGSPATALSGGQGVNPGDPCTDANGTPGSIKTPGSVIVDSLNKALGTQQDSLLRMGNIGPQITSVLRDIGTIMSTVNFATQILGGPNSGGLFGVDSTSASNPTSRLSQFTPTTASGAFNPNSNYLGASNTSVYQDAATSALASTDPLARISQYESAWNTIKTSAGTASTSVKSLVDFCTAAVTTAGTDPALASFVTAATEQIAAARSAFTAKISPVLAQAAATVPIIAAARAMAAKIQCEANVPTGTSVHCDPNDPTAVTDATNNTYSADVLTLQSMPPTARDIATSQQDAQNFGGAAASPAGSLNVSGSSLVDQMNLISTNASALKVSACTPPDLTGATTSSY